MKWNGSSGVQGATQDVKLEQCRLAGTVFLGAIVVTDGSKSEKKKKKKKGTQEEIGDEGSHKNG